MTAPTDEVRWSRDWRIANERRDRADERVRQLRDQLADALHDYAQADGEVYRLRQVERELASGGRHFERRP